MSHPAHPEPPLDSAEQATPTTSEIPVVRPAGTATRSLPPHPGATPLSATPPNTTQPNTTPPNTAQPAAPTEAPQPTGPVDFVPGLPGVGTPPPPPPAAAPPSAPGTGPVWPETLESDAPAQHGPRPARAPRDRRALTRVGLTVLALVLLQLGLVLDFGADSLWSAVTLWSAFATLAVVAALLAFVLSAAPGARFREAAAWRIAAVGLVGLAVFWLLVGLPNAASDRGFLLTAALACLGAALWAGSARKTV
jgi:hypothetical protein